MDASSFLTLAMACAAQVDARTAQALVAVESGFNPHAIGVVGGVLDRQPRNRAEALATARMLRVNGWDFSVGLAQINRRNFDRLGLTLATAFEPCANLGAMQAVLSECFERASGQARSQAEGFRAIPPGRSQQALRQALSCYYSGNFVTGVQHGYVRRVVSAAVRPPVLSTQPKEAP
jgi:type IV secretion system protein VirB1